MGAGLNLSKKAFHLQNWHQDMKVTRTLGLCPATRESVQVEEIISMHVGNGDLRVGVWCSVVENLVIDVLHRLSFINKCIRGIFSTERKGVPVYSLPVATISTLPRVTSLLSNMEHPTVACAFNEKAKRETLPCRVASSVTVPPSTQVAISVKSEAAGLAMIKPNDDVTERHQTKVARGTKDIMLGPPFHVNVANMSGQSCSSAETCVRFVCVFTHAVQSTPAW